MHAQKRPAGTPRKRSSSRPLVQDLLRAGEAGDRDRFDELFDLWLDAVFARASASRRDREAAEELTRKVLSDAVRTAASAL